MSTKHHAVTARWPRAAGAANTAQSPASLQL